jgi:hypothetical protein
MADKIRKVSYYYTMAPNRPGSAAKILRALRAADVNLLAFSGFPSGRAAQLDFVPEKGGAFLRAMRKAGVKLSKRKIGFLVEGGDRIGACAAVLDKLAKAKINVTATDAVSAGKGRFGAILWVKRRDVARAAKALHAR